MPHTRGSTLIVGITQVETAMAKSSVQIGAKTSERTGGLYIGD